MKLGIDDGWLSAAQIAALALPGLPCSKRKINERAQRERWALRSNALGERLTRPRAARGGGIEYHVDVLPAEARTAFRQIKAADPDLRPTSALNDQVAEDAEDRVRSARAQLAAESLTALIKSGKIGKEIVGPVADLLDAVVAFGLFDSQNISHSARDNIIEVVDAFSCHFRKVLG